MHAPTSQQIAEGQKASDQVEAYLSFERRGLVYYQLGMIALSWVADFLVARLVFKPYSWPFIGFISLPVLGLINIVYARNYFKKRHVWNVQFLAKLEAEFGEQLPWVQERNHLAKLRTILEEEALANTSSPEGMT